MNEGGSSEIEREREGSLGKDSNTIILTCYYGAFMP